MFRLLSLCCRHLCNLTSPPTSSEQFSQGYLRSCLPGLSPKNLHQIKHNSQKKKKKHNSQLSGCDCFLSQHHWREALSTQLFDSSQGPTVTSARQAAPGLWERVSTAPQGWVKVDVPYWFLRQPAGLSAQEISVKHRGQGSSQWCQWEAWFD